MNRQEVSSHLHFSLMTFRSPVAVLCATAMLSACSGISSISGAYPFPTELPTLETLNTNYQNLTHDLSPLPSYHFRIQVPQGWKTLDTALKTEPAKDDLADVAVFRQPGEWMNDAAAQINGEISVSVVNVSGSTLSPRDWLEGILQKNVKGYKVINKRVSPSAAGEVPDVLIQYTAGDEVIVSRMMAFKSGSRMFIITGSDAASEYEKNAEAYNVAISSFRLVSPAK